MTQGVHVRVFIISLVLGCSAAGLIAQETISTSSRTALLQSQLDVIDGRAAQQYNNSVRLQPQPIVVPGAPGSIPAYSGGYSGEYLELAESAARKYGIPPNLFLRLVQQESGWDPRAVSTKGAIGLAQLMPATAQSLGVDPNNVAENLDGGARYLSEQFRKFGTWRLALAAYNAGPGAVEQYGGIPPYQETQDYVRIILGG